MAKSKETTQVQIRVFRCTDCTGYYIAVGQLQRSIGSIVPTSCMFVNKALRGCDGSYKIVSKANAHDFLVELGQAVQSDNGLETDQSDAEGGGKR